MYHEHVQPAGPEHAAWMPFGWLLPENSGTVVGLPPGVVPVGRVWTGEEGAMVMHSYEHFCHFARERLGLPHAPELIIHPIDCCRTGTTEEMDMWRDLQVPYYELTQWYAPRVSSGSGEPRLQRWCEALQSAFQCGGDGGLDRFMRICDAQHAELAATSSTPVLRSPMMGDDGGREAYLAIHAALQQGRFQGGSTQERLGELVHALRECAEALWQSVARDDWEQFRRVFETSAFRLESGVMRLLLESLHARAPFVRPGGEFHGAGLVHIIHEQMRVRQREMHPPKTWARMMQAVAELRDFAHPSAIVCREPDCVEYALATSLLRLGQPRPGV